MHLLSCPLLPPSLADFVIIRLSLRVPGTIGLVLNILIILAGFLTSDPALSLPALEVYLAVLEEHLHQFIDVSEVSLDNGLAIDLGDVEVELCAE